VIELVGVFVTGAERYRARNLLRGRVVAKRKRVTKKVKPDWTSDDGTVDLYCGDCLDILPTFEDGSVDAVVTDPPYGVDFKGKTTKYTEKASGGYESGDDAEIGPLFFKRWDGRAVVFPGTRICFDYPKPSEMGFVFCPAGAGRGRWGFMMGHPILYYGKCPYLQNGMGHRPNGFRSLHTAESNGHPCPKPIEWMQFAVKKASAFAGDTILDPFMGSGTTGVACVELGRRFIGIEKEPKYFEIAVQRIKEELQKPKLIKPKVSKKKSKSSLFDGTKGK